MILVSSISLANCYVVSTIPRPIYERSLLTQPSFSSTLVSPTPRVITPYTFDNPLAPYSPKDHPNHPIGKINLLSLRNLISSTSFILNHDPYKRSFSPSNGSFATKLAFSSKGPRNLYQILSEHPHPRKFCLNRRHLVKNGPFSSPLPQAHHHKVRQL